MEHSRAPGVVVVGAGIIGLTAAWRALAAGAAVTVLDPAPGDGATHAAAGMLGPAMEAEFGEERLARIGAESARLWPRFAAELERAAGLAPGALGLDTAGTLAVAYDADDVALLRRRLALHRELGLESEEITPAEARDREPSLGPRVSAAAWVPGDHQVDPRVVQSALLDVVRAHPRGRLVERAVTTLIWEDGAVVGVRDDAGTAWVAGAPTEVADGPVAVGSADGAGGDGPDEAGRGGRRRGGIVVLAAGHASAALYPGAPTRAVPGTTLRLDAEVSLGPSVVVRGTVQGRPVYVVPRRPRADGRREIVVGATSDERAATTRTRAGDVFALLRDARALLPALDEADLVETTTRSRPGSPDNAPLLGEAAPGLLLATGHHRGGILLAPLTAAVVDHRPGVVDHGQAVAPPAGPDAAGVARIAEAAAPLLDPRRLERRSTAPAAHPRTTEGAPS
ncbi:FAD-dependent oxidoreductase [Myceligenerans pegani]|uniref:FAD-dependent oxidoreductase n=1 Tax=Myceligenerans pegani TaxID=2776917 RepID=A0ABR9MWK4_9MICO|nr:FAD-dependent oxidoreductase [Myceligenerans sp. TRM 65318]MBE1875763.1 FAD-dependent oxidoreductase [Myceligenerans sp. TRM 65318]MBE3018034.1 FAD-dependent oxidoreductase [Myceligenerans sp. TRM 65318]